LRGLVQLAKIDMLSARREAKLQAELRPLSRRCSRIRLPCVTKIDI